MQTIKTPAFTCRTIQAVINRYGLRKRGTEVKGAYPLDVGYMTPKEIQERNPDLAMNVIYARLFTGERRLEMLIRPAQLPKGPRTQKQKEGFAKRMGGARKAESVAFERLQYLRRLKAGHKQL